jgi:hypothetical protein
MSRHRAIERRPGDAGRRVGFSGRVVPPRGEAFMNTRRIAVLVAAAIAIFTVGQAAAWNPVPVKEDPLVRMPGTQPDNGVALEAPNRCLNCHAGYNTSVEPGFGWKGSMMAQSARDPLFWATLVVAAQDSIWATGTPNATDICLRCHMPKGWLEGRSDPTNASAMGGADFDGIQCDFCHRMYDPFHERTFAGGSGDGGWDETNASSTPSGPAAESTLAADKAEAAAIRSFNGEPFYDSTTGLPVSGEYQESTGGQYFVATDSAKRASFADAAARHQMQYSRFHKSKFFCATCHDVSNPVLGNLGADPTQLLVTEQKSAHQYFHVERTFSEFMLSDYGQEGGAAGLGPFSPGSFETSAANNYIRMCQDCHMRDVVGRAANKNGAPLRPDESIEHPESGLPLHDLTGGNYFIPWVLASTVAGSPNYDATNDALLNQGPGVLAMDLQAGQGLDPEALLAGADRAMQQLALAAKIEGLSYDATSGALSFQIQNQTGHKLISGYPEGRRIFINIKAFSGGTLLYEVNPYDTNAGTLKGLEATYSSDLVVPEALGSGESHEDELVYEAQMASSLTGESHTFHFALATGRYKDNRIPPKGFRINEAAARMAVPVWHGVEDPDFYTASEYAGGYADVSLTIPPGADGVEVSLYYQTTSREYIEFLRNEINGTAPTTLTGTGAGGDEPYLAQTDPFFANMSAWGNVIWDLWTHNMNVPGAAPILMASMSVGDTGGGGGGGCTAPTPTLESVIPSHNQVDLAWSDMHSADAEIIGYGVYYDQSGKAQPVADVGLLTSYSDTGLTDGQQYCYMVTSKKADCESAFSNVECATPQPSSTATIRADELVTGQLVTSGKGKNATTTWTQGSSFSQGDTVTLRVRLIDGDGVPVEGGSVTLRISGPEVATVNSGASDADGYAYAEWKTSAPRKGRGGTATGSYTASVTDVSASGYNWDSVATSTSFTVSP